LLLRNVGSGRRNKEHAKRQSNFPELHEILRSKVELRGRFLIKKSKLATTVALPQSSMIDAVGAAPKSRPVALVQSVQVPAGLAVLLVCAVVKNRTTIIWSIPALRLVPRQKLRPFNIRVGPGFHLAAFEERHQTYEFISPTRPTCIKGKTITTTEREAEGDIRVGTRAFSTFLPVIGQIARGHPAVRSGMGDVAEAVGAAFSNVHRLAS
jgi:hypothetical protein